MKRTAVILTLGLVLFLFAGITDVYGDSVDDYFSRGNSYKANGEYYKAIEEFRKVLRIRPDAFEAYSNIGLSYNALGKYQEAIDNFKTAIRINPDNDIAYGGMGSAYFQLKEHQQAVNSYKNAIRIKPDLAYYYDGLGFNYGFLGQNEEGLKNLRKAAELYRREGDYDRVAILKEMIRSLAAAQPVKDKWEFVSNKYMGFKFDDIKVFRMVEKEQGCEKLKVTKRVECTDDSCEMMDTMRDFCAVWNCDGPYEGNKGKKIAVKYEQSSYMFDCKNNKYMSLGTIWYGFDDLLIGRSMWLEPKWAELPIDNAELKDEISFVCKKCVAED